MAKWAFVVEYNCTDPSREAEYNNWYHNTHMPDVLGTPGFIKATRYENTDTSGGKAKFLVIYEIESNDIDATMKALGVHLAEKRAEGAGHTSELGQSVGRGTYKHDYFLSR